jgi:O-antigen/teichoic acid export membrane protein
LDWGKIKKDLLLASSSHFFYKIAGYIILTILTRYLTKGEMGEFFFAASFASLFAMISELGMNGYLIRTIARQPEKAQGLMSEMVSLRLPIYAGYFILLNGFTYLFKYDLFLIVFLTSIYIFFDNLYLCFGALFIGLKRVIYNVFSGVSTRILLIGFILIVVAKKGTLVSVVNCYILANFFLVLISFVFTWQIIGGIRFVLNIDSAKTILTGSFPLYVLSLLSLIHFKIDSIMIGFLRPYSEVATYEAGYKLLEASRFIIMPITMIFFPVFSELSGQRKFKEIKLLLTKMLFRLGGIGSLIMILVGLTAGVIIPTVFGPNYDESISVLRILFLSVPFLYIATVSALVAKSLLLDKKTIKIMLTCMVANIFLNSFAIPLWGAVGAACTTIATEALLAVWIVKLVLSELRWQYLRDSDIRVRKEIDYVR